MKVRLNGKWETIVPGPCGFREAAIHALHTHLKETRLSKKEAESIACIAWVECGGDWGDAYAQAFHAVSKAAVAAKK